MLRLKTRLYRPRWSSKAYQANMPVLQALRIRIGMTGRSQLAMSMAQISATNSVSDDGSRRAGHAIRPARR